MEVFDRIADQLDAVGLPLFAVTLTALPRVNTPVLLMLHWHGFRADPERSAERPPTVPLSPVPGSALQMNPSWDALECLDRAMLDAAWRLGAWELDREERRGCMSAGASVREELECRQAFGAPPFGDDGDDFMLAEAPDRTQMLELGARVGYVHWRFLPVRGGVWRDTARDDTLADDGGRAPPCAVRATVDAGTGRVRYLLGRVDAIIGP